MNERLAALPGVEHASISATVPFGMISLSKNVQRAGIRPGPDDKPTTAAEGLAFNADWNSVSADYFSTVGLSILRGRSFSAAEATQPDGPLVAIIDEVLAKNFGRTAMRSVSAFNSRATTRRARKAAAAWA